MATSGSLLSTKIYNGSTNFYFQVDWVATQDEKTNTSKIDWKFYFKSNVANGWANVRNVYFDIGNSSSDKDAVAIQVAAARKTCSNYSVQIGYGSKTFTHNPDGTKDFYIGIRGEIYGTAYSTSNASKTETLDSLYQLPIINLNSVDRCLADGTLSLTGTYAKISYEASVMEGKTIKSIVFSVNSHNVTTTSASGNVVVGNGTLATNVQYVLNVTITDSNDISTTASALIPASVMPLSLVDNGNGGVGVSVGQQANDDNIGYFDCYLGARFHSTVELGNVFSQDILWSGSLTSGNTGAFDIKGHSVFIIEGKTGGSSWQTRVVPSAMIPASGNSTVWALTSEANYITFHMARSGTDKMILYRDGGTSTSYYISRIVGIL